MHIVWKSLRRIKHKKLQHGFVSFLYFCCHSFFSAPLCLSKVNVLRKKSANGLWEGSVEQVVRRLEKAGQITEQTLDNFLCHTPSGKKRPLGIMEQERKTSRRTLRPLQSTLLSEWAWSRRVSVNILICTFWSSPSSQIQAHALASTTSFLIKTTSDIFG